jgi:RsiW-degrading membrane proteinase PrsW (M82 family)
MTIMGAVYHLIVLYLAIQLTVLLFRERKAGRQAGIAMVLVLFLLRLLLIQ